MKRFSLSVGEPWDFQGPDGPNLLFVELLGIVGGPKEDSWALRSLLLQASTPFEMDGEHVQLMVASPRYVGDTIESVASVGGTVGVARVRPGVSLISGASYNTTDISYCIIGELKPL